MGESHLEDFEGPHLRINIVTSIDILLADLCCMSPAHSQKDWTLLPGSVPERGCCQFVGLVPVGPEGA